MRHYPDLSESSPLGAALHIVGYATIMVLTALAMTGCGKDPPTYRNPITDCRSLSTDRTCGDGLMVPPERY